MRIGPTVALLAILLVPAARAEEEEMSWGESPAIRVGDRELSRADVGRRLVAVHGRAVARGVLVRIQLEHGLRSKGLTVEPDAVEEQRSQLTETLEARGETIETVISRTGITRSAIERSLWNAAAGRILAKKVGVAPQEIARYLSLNFPVLATDEVEDPVFARVGDEELLVRTLAEETLPLVSPVARDRFLEGVVNGEVLDRALRTAKAPDDTDLDILENREQSRLSEELDGKVDLERVLRARGQTREAFRAALGRREHLRRALLADLKPDDETLRAHLERWRDYFEGRRVRATHVLVAVESPGGEKEWAAALEKARSIRDQAVAGTDLGDLALLHSDDTPTKIRRGDLGFLPRKSRSFAPELLATVFARSPDTIGEPVKTARGYHVIRVTEVREGRRVDFESERGRIRSDWADSRQMQWLTGLRKGVEVEVLWDDLKVKADVEMPRKGDE